MRLRIDSFGLPWNIPQSMRTRARSVVRRNCEPVTVVAAPRNWSCIGGVCHCAARSAGSQRPAHRSAEPLGYHPAMRERWVSVEVVHGCPDSCSGWSRSVLGSR